MKSGAQQAGMLRARPRTRVADGFTLLEVLLALVLMAFVMLGVWGALRGATRITHSADALMARSESVRTAQQFLRRYVGMAEMQPYVTDAAQTARMFHGTPDSMRFVAPLPRQSGQAGLYLQTIRLVPGDGGHSVLQLSWQPYAESPVSQGDATTHVLLSGLAGGKFQYLAAAAFGKPAAWRDDWLAINGLPLAVRIHLDPAWRERVRFPDMVIAVHGGEGMGTRVGGGAP